MHSTHDQHQRAWNTAESCGVTERGYVQRRRLSLMRVSGLLLGQAHSVVMARPSGRLYKLVFFIVKGWFHSWLVVQLDSWLVGSVISCSYLMGTRSQLAELVCNNAQGLTEREEYIVRETIYR